MMNQTRSHGMGKTVTAEDKLQNNRTDLLSRMGLIAAAVFTAFILGFVPMWLSARGYENERDAAVENLRPSALQNDLATAVIYARRAEFEPARQQASDFFTALRAEVDRENSLLSHRRSAVERILAERDTVITLLAQNDPAAADKLAGLYLDFMQSNNWPGAEE